MFNFKNTQQHLKTLTNDRMHAIEPDIEESHIGNDSIYYLSVHVYIHIATAISRLLFNQKLSGSIHAE